MWNLHRVKMHYLYDTHGRVMRIEFKVETVKFDSFYIRFDNQTGILQSISDLKITRKNILETNIIDQNREFNCTKIRDSYGRIAKKRMTIQGRSVFQLQISYDSRGRVSKIVVEISGRRELANYSYKDDGQLEEASGTHKRQYSYDKNGNIILYTDNTRTEFLHYDDFDRVMKVGDGNINYDARGYAIVYDSQNFEFNAKGQLIKAWFSDKRLAFTIGYDHLDRVYVYKDYSGAVTQFIYSRLDEPNLITHVHDPKAKSTTILIYDDQNFLIAMDRPNGRYYVATDEAGTPLAYYEENGALVYRQKWTSFGRLVETTGVS